MEQIETDNDNNIYINPKRFIKIINDKCLDKLGRKGINDIYYSPNKKVIVEFTDGIVINYANYRDAFDHLNVAYNLKMSVEIKNNKSKVVKVDKENLSAINIAKSKIETLIKSFKNVKNVKLNNLNLDEYFNSNEWKKNNFNKDEIGEIISHLEKLQDNDTKKYVDTVKRNLSRLTYI
ncbi:hypothetical protein [Sulfurimonas sp.]